MRLSPWLVAALAVAGCLAGPGQDGSTLDANATTQGAGGTAAAGTDLPVGASGTQTPSSSPTADPDPILPVVAVSSTFRRTYANGTEWRPPFPGYHGCPDDFRIDATRQTVVLDDYSDPWTTAPATTTSTSSPSSDPPAGPVPAAAIAVQDRDPGAHDRNSQLRLPATVPNATLLPLGNVEGRHVTLTVERGHVRVDQAEVPAGPARAFTYEYPWRRSDGETLTVQETLQVRYFGDWTDPMRSEKGQLCI